MILFLIFFWETLFLIYLFFLIIKYNSLYSSAKLNKKLIYNKDYLSIVYEAYSKTPNITKILKCISNFYKNKSLPEFFILDGIRAYAKSIRMTNISNKLKYTDGDIGSHYYQMKHYNQLINDQDKVKKIKNICEVGFQLGVGAITMITSVKHDIIYYGFDFGKVYSKEAYNLLSRFFSMNMTWGDSQKVIPFFFKNNLGFSKCDVVHIDACHHQNVIYNDIINMRKISHAYTSLLLDDVNFNSLSILEAKKNNLITNVKCFEWKPYCIAKYTIKTNML